MALPNKTLAGASFTLYAQPGANPTPLTTANLSVLASVSAIAIAANTLNVQAIPVFGQEDAVATFSVAGSRQSDKIPVQAPAASMAVTAAWNPSDAVLQQVQTDSKALYTDRTYVVAAVDGANIAYTAFNARVGGFSIDAQPGAEAKCVFTLHPRANQSGQSNSV
ncbi:MAG: hypothetical protein WBI20_14865 [Burkholderiaceae bacterium]